MPRLRNAEVFRCAGITPKVRCHRYGSEWITVTTAHLRRALKDQNLTREVRMRIYDMMQARRRVRGRY